MKTINAFRSKFFALVLALVASVSSFAKDGYPDFQVDGLYYNFLEGDSVQVTFLRTPPVPTEVAADTSNKKNVSGAGYGHLTEIVIPSTVIYEDKTYHVTRIGHGSFLKCVNLQHVDLPTSIKSIGVAAFWSCHSLSSIALNEGLESIEEHALWDCPTLKEVTLPSTLKSLGQKVFGESISLSKVICKAAVPPVVENDLLTGTDNYNASIIPNATLYVPVESLEAYKIAAVWKEFGQILPITWSEECYEYRDFNLGIELFPRKSSLVYTLYHTDDRTIEPPYVDSVWILDPELDKQNPLHVHTSYAQPGDTIDLSFLEKNKHYILRVHINECQMSRVFLHRVVKWEYKWCNQWNVLWFDGMRFDETASTSHYQLGQDTVIGDYTYRKFTSRTSVRFTEDWKVYVYYEGFDDNDPYTEDLPTGEYLAYDFSAQVGDTLEVFSGIGTYSTYLCVVDDVQQTDIQTALRTITLHKICRMDTDGDGVEEEYALGEMTWIEGVGSSNGFLIGTTLPGGGTYALLCAYNDDELKYTGDLYDEYGCEYNATEQKPEDLFPTLWGLQRTSFTEYSECSDSYASLFQSKGETITINDNQYLKFGGHYLREENKQVLLYSRLQDKDLVLYDYSLEVGDTLTTLNIDYRIEGIPFDLCYVDYAYEDVGMSHSIDTLIVTDVSYVTLLDGKEYKKWTFDNGMEYVEGIGMYGGRRNGNFFGLIQEVVVPCHIGTHLVCASRNGKLLYQMDDAEMERLGAECLCDYNSGPKKDNAKNGKIGGRPTPTQWNMLEVETKEMDGTPTILRAETFSYTLENDSIVTKGKTFYQLARQSTKDTAITKFFVGALYFGEDEDNRVYFLRDGVEYVLYDFTAEPGDSIEIFAGINNYPQETTYTHVVVDKDTTEDGACRMFLEVVFPDETTTTTNAEKVWLAGLGSIDGIVHNAAKRTSDAHAAPRRSASSETQTSVMLCAWREDSCLYTTNHPEYDTFGCVYNQDPTAVEDVQTSGDKYQKIIRDGHLYILRDNKLYDVLGSPILKN